MILAAGRGERLRPLTDELPKPLLEIDGKPLIVHVIERLRAAGIQDLVVNHSWLGARIEATLAHGGELGMRIRYSPEPPGALETGGGILRALPLLGEHPFIVCNGDLWCDYDFGRLPSQPTGLAHLVLVDNPPEHPEGDFVLHEDRVIEGEGLRLTFSGIGVYRPALFHRCDPGRFPLAPVLRRAVAQNTVSGEHHRGVWCDVGTPQRLDAVRRRLRRERRK